jgi:sulfotransferase family protein
MKPYVDPSLLPAYRKRAIKAYRALTARIRLMPDFIIIGGNRCGTAALYQYLCGHPSIMPSFHREAHFFERYFARGVTWYRGNFPLIPHKYYVIKFGRKRFVTGEATTYYIFHPHAPRRILETVPGVRLIALLRNPVNRAYAQYHQKIRQGRETLSFSDAIEAEPERLRGEREKMLADQSYISIPDRDYSYLSRGVYVDQLAHWMNLFPQEQMLILRSEDLRVNPSGVVGDVLKFLKLPAWQPEAPNNYGQAEYPKMDARIRSRLIEYFKPHNRRLYEFLGRDFGWDG